MLTPSTDPRSNYLTDLAAKIREEHDAVEAAKGTATAAVQRGIEHALACGDLLNEAKAQLPQASGSRTCVTNATSPSAPPNSICNSQQAGQPWMLKSATLRI